MRLLAATAALAAASAAPAGDALPDFPNIHRVGYGIDLAKSNPEAADADPGVRGLVLDVTASYDDSRSWEGQWRLPTGVSARPDPRCSYSAAVATVHDTFELQTQLDWVSKTRYHGLIFAHTWTDEFSSVGDATRAAATVFTRAKATCVAYEAAVQRFELSPAQVAPDFAKGVASLAANDTASLQQFVGAFGTHYLSEAVLGGMAVRSTSFTQANYTSLQAQGVDVEGAAALDFLQAFGADVSGYEGAADDLPAFLAHADANPAQAAIPFAPPSGAGVADSANAWAAKIQLPDGQPDLVGYTLADLSELLSADLFPGDPDIEAKAAALQSYIDTQYCQEDLGCPLPSHELAWAAADAAPAPLAGAAAGAVGDTAFFYGGWESGLLDEYSALAYDTRADKWVFVPPPPAAVYAAGAAVLGGRLYMCGGFPGDANTKPDALADCFVMDPAAEHTWAAAPAMQQARYHQAFAAVGNDTLVAIGGTDSAKNRFASVEALSLSAGAWTSLADMPDARYEATAVADAAGERVYVFGGRDADENAVGDVWVLDVAANAWSALSNPMQPALTGASTVLVGDAVFVLGGVTQEGDTATNSVQVFDLATSEWWVTAPQLFAPASYAQAVAVPGANATEVHFLGGFTGGYAGQTSAQHFVATVWDDFAPFGSHRRARPHGYGYGYGYGGMLRPHSQGVAPANTFPSVDYMGFGYNVIRGNPASAVYDEGWSAQPVFDVACGECFSQNRSFDGWAVPDGVNVNVLESCSYDATTFLIRDRTELDNFLSASVSLDIRLGTPLLASVKWSASGDLQATLGAALDAGAAVVVAQASCQAYEMALDHYSYAYAFSQNLVDALQALPDEDFDPASSDAQPWFQFVESFGTHVPSGMAVGGTASQRTVLGQLQLAELLDGGVDVDFAARASLLLFWGSSHEDVGELAFQQYLQLQASASANSTACAPACPPHAADVMTNATAWADRVMLPDGFPVPVRTDLVELTSVLAPANFPANLSAVVARQQRNLEWFIGNGTYCAMVDGCAPSPSTSGDDAFWAPAPGGALPVALAGAAGAALGDGRWAVAAGDQALAINASAAHGSWAALSPLPTPRAFAAAGVAAGGELVVAGGAQSADGAASAEVSRLLVGAEPAWRAGEPMPEARSHAAAAQIGDTLFVACGLGPDGAARGDLVALNVTSGEWSAPAGNASIPARYGAAAAAVGGQLFVLGGVAADGGLLADVQAYDPAARAWTQLQATLPEPRARAAAAVVNGSVAVVAGGVVQALDGSQAAASSVLAFEPALLEVRPLPALPGTLVDSLAFSAVGGGVTVVGGVAADGGEAEASVSELSSV